MIRIVQFSGIPCIFISKQLSAIATPIPLAATQQPQFSPNKISIQLTRNELIACKILSNTPVTVQTSADLQDA